MPSAPSWSACALSALLLLAACWHSTAIVHENFTYNPDVDVPPTGQLDLKKVVPFLWAQTGEIHSTRVRKEPQAVQTSATNPSTSPLSGGLLGSSSSSSSGSPSNADNVMKLTRRHPVAETALLDWDGVDKEVMFSTCTYKEWCEAAPGSLALLWSNDSIVWQPLWNNTFVNVSSIHDSGSRGCTWSNVTIPLLLPVDTASTPVQFAFKWVHMDVSKRCSASAGDCSATQLDDISLPAQPPTAANMAYGKAATAPAVTAASCSGCAAMCKTASVSGVGIGGGRRRFS